KEASKFSVLDWQVFMQNLLLNTKIYTPWALEAFGDRKNRNVDEINGELREAEKEDIRKKTGKDFGRGVDTVYRVTLKNHMDFSSIADGKANMIISINTLVLSIIITVGSAGLSMGQAFMIERRMLIIPLVILMLSSLIAIVFAVLSAIPKVSQNIFAKEDIAAHKVSMLYFGNFLQLSKPEFVDYLKDLKEDQEILYDDLSKDLYSLGQVLQKKYRLLTISYRVFIGGLVLSVVALLVILLLM
ncbi:MAG: Pycsar system effector family protein, partial [Bacteroidota bacterium]